MLPLTSVQTDVLYIYLHASLPDTTYMPVLQTMTHTGHEINT